MTVEALGHEEDYRVRLIVWRHRRPRPMLVDSLHRDSLFVLGEAEFDAAVAGVEPAAGDGLAAGEELRTVHAVGVGIAEQRGFPAAEAVVGHRHWDRHVDADHADLDLVLESPGRATVVGEDRRAVAIRVGVDQIQRVVVGLDAHHREHGSEDLVGVDAHLGGDVVDQRGAEPEPVLTTVGLHVAPVDDDLGAVGLAGVDVGGHLVAVGLGPR
jgi:hypothetical protein